MRSNMVTGDLHDLLVHVDDAVSTLVDVVTQDRRVGLGAWPHDELSAAASAVTALAARLGFVRAALTRELDVRGSFREDACVSAVGWLRMHARLTPAEAAAVVRLARGLGSVPASAGAAANAESAGSGDAAPDGAAAFGAPARPLDATTAAFAAGEIREEHARVIVEGCADAPEGAVALFEPEVLEVAREADPRAVTALMRRFEHALDPDGADEKALRRQERRGLTLVSLPDGTTLLRGLADEVTGSLMHRGRRGVARRQRRPTHGGAATLRRAGRHLPQVPGLPRRADARRRARPRHRHRRRGDARRAIALGPGGNGPGARRPPAAVAPAAVATAAVAPAAVATAAVALALLLTKQLQT
jgi:hypothetical protein